MQSGILEHYRAGQNSRSFVSRSVTCEHRSLTRFDGRANVQHISNAVSGSFSSSAVNTIGHVTSHDQITFSQCSDTCLDTDKLQQSSLRD